MTPKVQLHDLYTNKLLKKLSIRIGVHFTVPGRLTASIFHWNLLINLFINLTSQPKNCTQALNNYYRRWKFHGTDCLPPFITVLCFSNCARWSHSKGAARCTQIWRRGEWGGWPPPLPPCLNQKQIDFYKTSQKYIEKLTQWTWFL